MKLSKNSARAQRLDRHSTRRPFEYRLRYLVLAGFLALAGGGAGVAIAVTGDSQTKQFPLPPDQYAPAINSTFADQFADKSAPEVLDQVRARYRGHAIVDAKVDGPPPGFQATDGSVPVPESFKNGKWIYMTVAAQSNTFLADRPLWEAGLVVGAVRDAMHDNGDYLYASRLSLLLPNGETVADVDGCCGNVVYDQLFDTPPADQIPSIIRAAATNSGLTIKSVEIINVDQPAPAVVATTDEEPVKLFSQLGDITRQLFGRPTRYEGYYLEIRGQGSEPIVIEMANFRTGESTRWVPYKFLCSAGGSQPVSCLDSSG